MSKSMSEAIHNLSQRSPDDDKPLKVEESASAAFSRGEAPVGRESGSMCLCNPVQVVLSAPIRGTQRLC